MSTINQDSSLDRFIRQQATSLVGFSGWRNSPALGFGIAGTMNCAIGVCFIVAAFVTQQRELFVPGTMLAVSGATFTGVAAAFRRKGQSVERSQVEMTTDARMLVIRLASHVGWTDHRSRVVPAGPEVWFKIHNRSCAEILNPQAYELLNGAAHQFNRIEGALQIAQASGQSSITRSASTIRFGATEAMVIAFQCAAMIDKFPEGAAAHIERANQSIKLLTETASLLESSVSELSHQETSATTPTALNRILEDLRLDNLARKELVFEDDDPEKERFETR